MGKQKRQKDKFKFNIDFQEAILQYTVTNKYGYRALELYQDYYFDLLTHQIIAFVLKRYYKKKKRIPSKVVLHEHLRQLYENPEYRKDITSEVKKDIEDLLHHIYLIPLGGGEDILEEVIKFARFIEVKNELESTDARDYKNYETLQRNLQRAINIGTDLQTKRGIKLIQDAETRISNRNNEVDVFHTPFWQLNRSQNSGGLKKHALIMLMSEAKRFKTGGLINFAMACLRRRKKGIYFDLENGEAQLSNRADQNIVNTDELNLRSGLYDKKLLKQIRKYRRIGAELVIVRLPGGSTTMDMLKIMDDYELEEGLVFDFAIVDYGDLMNSNNGTKDETQRINEAFLDIKNLAIQKDLDFIATASHVKREAYKRKETKYLASDVAKCIDKIRHLDICIGLQESEEEKENGVLRWEIIEQRDGPQNFTMYFWINIPHQRLKEFTKQEVKNLKEQFEKPTEEDIKNRSKAQKDI